MEIDFETYSEAGFIWDEQTQKYKAPPHAMKKGLPTIGAAVYSEHPSTEVLSCAYDLGDGVKKLWIPGMLPPFDLFDYVQRGGLVHAWSVKFERWIWINVCMKKYGWPPVPESQWRDTAANAVAHALPKSLDPCGRVLNIVHKKDKDGVRLLNKFSMPRNPTKHNPARRIRPCDDPEDAKNLYAYNIRDIEAEHEIGTLVPELIPSELEFWQCDLAINARGVAIDMPLIQSATSIVNQAHDKYNLRLRQITGGEVSRASEVAKILAWLRAHGVKADSLDADTVTHLLKLVPPGPIREVLEIRELLSSAAVKKLYAMANQSTQSGRLHDLFIYHAARTGRAAGAGPQPQNLPNSGPRRWQCVGCNQYSYRNDICVMCNSIIPAGTADSEWCADSVEQAIMSINTGSLECVEYYEGNAIDTISGCLRGMFIAAPGHDLICSDYSAIEGLVLAALAGEKWRMDVFRTHGKLYEASASAITGTPLHEYTDYKKQHGTHHPDRKTGKVAELACFDSSTIVLTKRGYIPIVRVLKSDKLWDGEEWVTHSGVVYKGIKQTIQMDGVGVTPDHPIYMGLGGWKPAKLLCLNGEELRRGLAIGSEKLPSLTKSRNSRTTTEPPLNVIAAKGSTGWIPIKYGLERAWSVVTAQLKPGKKRPLGTQTLFPTLASGERRCLESKTPSLDATILKTRSTQIMEGGGLKFVTYGEHKAIKGLLWSTLSRWITGILQVLKWTESTVTATTNLEISDSFRNLKTFLTSAASNKCKQESMPLRNVYDVVNAGPRNRFTIKTKSGHLLVHNSGYGGWIGAWKAFGADSFMSEEQIKKTILAWRDASPAIVEMWGGQVRRWKPEFYGLEGCAVQAIQNPGVSYAHRAVSWICVSDVLYCSLPSGRKLTYHRPRLAPSPRKPGTFSISFEGWNSNPKYGSPGWVRLDTYGGKLTENVVQAVARDILAHAIVNLERAGYPIVLQVHDELVAEVPESFGSVEEFERIMSVMPPWATDWPVKAAGGWRRKRYGK